MSKYGMIYDVNSIKRQLYDSNRGYNQRKSWESLYLGNDMTGQKSHAYATNIYSDAVNEAYNASTMNINAIQGSNLGQGFKKQLLEQNDLSIQQAFDSYSQNLANTRQGIDYNVEQNAASIDNAATEQATNIKDYANAHFNYLEHLYQGYESGENTLFDSKQWSKYLENVLDEEGMETGERRLLSREELMTPSFVEGPNGEKEWTSLYDDMGNLTVKGLDFFDQIQNQNITANSFGSYLAGEQYAGESKEDAARRNKLFEWSQTYNPFNYTFDGTNKGSFRTMVGMSSMDNTYSFAERYGGFTREQVDNLYKDFKTAVTDLSTKSKHAKDTTSSVNAVINEIEKLAVDLGIEDDFGFDKIKAEAEAYIEATKTGGEMTGDWFGTTAATTVGGAATGAGIGGVVGGGPGAGVGALVGGGISLIGGIIMASINTSNQRKTNVSSAEKSKEMYTELLNYMINYSQYKRKQTQLDFAKQYNQF